MNGTMLAGYASCSQTLVVTPAERLELDQSVDEGAPDAPITVRRVSRQVSVEPLLRVWIGGLACGGEVPKSSAECPRPKDTTKDVSKDEDFATFFDVYDVDKGCDIAKGGFGVVCRAVHRSSDTICAVKVIDKEVAGKSYRDHLVDGGVYDCLLRMTIETPSPHVVRYLDLLEGAQNYFVVMEPLDGVELLEQFEQDLPVTERYCQHVMTQVLRTLSHLHNVVGLIHRDIKLENFRYRRRSKESELVLVDFGLARFISEEWDGSVSGTLLYLAPEAVRAIAPDATEGYAAPADVWSAGLIFYMMLLGKVPWNDTTIWTLGKTEREARALLDATFDDAMLKHFTAEATDLLHCLLDYDSKSRISAAEAVEHPWFSLSGPLLERTLTNDCYGIVREVSRASRVWTSHAPDTYMDAKMTDAKASDRASKISKTGPIPVCVPVCLAPPAFSPGISEDYI